ncbi:MAG: hypothetical protein Q8L88_02745 [Bacteroidota bacterium]|nr:hypothetical protein [Bacteroidota bacterium]
MDKRIIIIAILAVTAIILTIVRESGDPGGETFSLIQSSKQQISGDRVYAMADTTLRTLGIKKGNIRPIKNRNDVRVLMPQSFDPLLFVRAMKDSLEEFEADIVSMENSKEKSSTVQVKNNDIILKSFLFSKEPVTIAKKGVSPLAKKSIK